MANKSTANLPRPGCDNSVNSVFEKPTVPGMPYIAGIKQMLGRNGSVDVLKNFSHCKANSIKKVIIKPKFARVFNSTSPKKSRFSNPSPGSIQIEHAINQAPKVTYNTPTNAAIPQAKSFQPVSPLQVQLSTEPAPMKNNKKVIPYKNLKFGPYRSGVSGTDQRNQHASSLPKPPLAKKQGTT